MFSVLSFFDQWNSLKLYVAGPKGHTSSDPSGNKGWKKREEGRVLFLLISCTGKLTIPGNCQVMINDDLQFCVLFNSISGWLISGQ